MFEAYLFIGFTYLLVKHFVFDFPHRIQTPWMFLNKGTYGHPGGIVHALLHSLATLPLTLWMIARITYYPIDGPTRVLICFVGEFFIHYHMDWFKMWWCAKKQYKPDTHSEFWLWLGIDQLVHGLTYVWIMYIMTIMS
jgi:hypothetical protein